MKDPIPKCAHCSVELPEELPGAHELLPCPKCGDRHRMISTGDRVSARYGVVPMAGNRPRFEIEVRIDGLAVWHGDGSAAAEAWLNLFTATKTSPVRNYDDPAVTRAVIDVFGAFSMPHEYGLAWIKQKVAADAVRARDEGADSPPLGPRDPHTR